MFFKVLSRWARIAGRRRLVGPGHQRPLAGLADLLAADGPGLDDGHEVVLRQPGVAGDHEDAVRPEVGRDADLSSVCERDTVDAGSSRRTPVSL
jgi:hypothetical protein